MSQAPSNFEQIVARLERVERQNLYLKRAGGAGLVLVWLAVGLSVLAALLSDDRIEAQQYTLLDAGGRPRAIWATGEAGGFYLLFYDAQQRERAVFGVTGDSRPVLGLMGEDEQARFACEIDSQGDPQLGLFDGQHRLRIAVKVSQGRQPKVSLLDEKRRQRAQLRLTDGGDAEIVLYDAEERPVRRLAPLSEVDTP